MAENSGTKWTIHMFNPWIGFTKAGADTHEDMGQPDQV